MKPAHRPRVTMIVSHVAPVFGMEKVVLTLLGLLRTKYDVRVVCIGGDSSDLRTCPEATLLGSPLRGFQRFRSIARLHRLARSIDTDLVIAVGAWVAVPWLLAGRRFWHRTIVWEHSMMVERIRHSRQLRFLSMAARFLYGRARLVVTVSGPLEFDIRSLCRAARVITVPNPVDVLPETPEIAHSSPVPHVTRLVSVGSLSEVKAQHMALQALSLLDDSFHLNIIGSGPERDNLERLAEELGLSSQVTFDGYLPAKRVRARMLESDLLIHCAVVETFGLVYVEAAEASLRVVSTRNRVAQEMIPNYVPGWISEPTPESLAAVIAERRSTVVDAEHLRDASVRRRTEFSTASVLAKWMSILELPNDQAKDEPANASVS